MNNRTDHPISYLDTLMKTESESIEAIIMRRRRIPFAGFVVRVEDETVEVCDVRRMGGGCALRRGTGKRVDGMFLGQPQNFRYQRRPVDDCSPGQGGMAQGGGTRGGAFQGEMGCCRKTRAGLRHAVLCSSVTGRTKERIAQSKRTRAGFLAVVDEPQVARNFILWVFLADVILPSSVTCCVMFCFFFVFLRALDPRPFAQSFFDMHAPRQPCAVT